MRLTLLFLLLHQLLFAQIIMDDTVCIDKPITISTKQQATGYYWNFCSGNLRTMPQGKMLNKIAEIEKPAFIDYAFTDAGIYAFVTNHDNATITRLFYGNSLHNTPTATNLGNFNKKIPKHTQGIQLAKDNNGNWFCFVVGGQKENSKLLRLSFGNSLENQATAQEFFFDKKLDYPIDLTIENWNGQWCGFTLSYNNSRLVRFNFGSSLENTPVAEVLADASVLKNPCGLAKYEENGKFYLFITNYMGNSISRASFGNSPLNAPQISSFESPSVLQFPFDLTILRDCEHLFGFVLNRFGTVVRMDFTDIDRKPEFTSFGAVDYLFNPQGISDVYRQGDTLYAYVANIDNSRITQLMFPTCDYAKPTWSKQQQPSPVVFSKLGEVNIRLETSDGSNNKTSYCKNVQIVENPTIDLVKEVLLLPGETVQLNAGDGYTSYHWSTNEKTQSITADKYKTYTVTVTNQYGCEAVDSIEVKFAGIPSVITPNNDGVNDTWEIRLIKLFPEVKISIYDRNGNLIISYNGAKYVWDCTDKNAQPVRADTYWYVVELGAGNKSQTGQVSVVRN